MEKEKILESLQKCGPTMDCELLPDFPNLCSNSVGQRDCNAGRSQKNGEEDRNRGRALLSLQNSSECQGIEKYGQKVTINPNKPQKVFEGKLQSGAS